jgi:DNA-directed RNA polymerase specialized sigma subunit
MNEEQRNLVVDNINYAKALSWIYAHRHKVDYYDLVSAAYEGLCIAAKEYDSYVGEYRHYARHWIIKMLNLEVQFLFGHDREIKWTRTKKPKHIVTVSDLFDHVDSRGDLLKSLQGHKYDILYDAIEELDSDDKYVINAFYFYRMTDIEICRELNRSSFYLRHRALRKLRDIVKGEYYEQVRSTTTP